MLRALSFISVCAVIAAIILAMHDTTATLKRWTVEDPDLPPLKVAVFADFHFSSLRDVQALADLKRQIIVEAPDVVLFAGDYLGNPSLLNQISRIEIATGLAALAHPRPAFAVLGNHDNWDARDAWLAAFASTAIRILENKTVTLDIADQTLCIRGIGDAYSGYAERTPIPDACGAAVITLTHDPAGLLLDETPLASLSVARTYPLWTNRISMARSAHYPDQCTARHALWAVPKKPRRADLGRTWCLNRSDPTGARYGTELGHSRDQLNCTGERESPLPSGGGASDEKHLGTTEGVRFALTPSTKEFADH